MEFYKFNLNPKERKVGDCVIRAISGATKKGWDEVYRDLFEIGIKEKYVVNDKQCYEKLLKEYGFIKYKQPRKVNRNKYKVSELGDLLSNSRVVVSMANHLSYIEKGLLVDTWNCSGKTVGNYWVHKDDKNARQI